MQNTDQREEFLINDDENIDIKELFYKIVSHWRLFALTIPVAIIGAYFINRYSDLIYSMNTTVLISVGNSGTSELDGLMGGFGMSKSRLAHYNELEMMKSKGLTESVVIDLGFELSYFNVGRVRLIEVYNEAPFYVEYDVNHNQISGNFFNVEWKQSNTFNIDIDFGEGSSTYNFSNKAFESFVPQENLNIQSKLGEWITSPNYKFRLII